MQPKTSLDNNHEIKQWVSKILNFSPGFNNDALGAMNLTGPPKIFPNYGDLNGTGLQKNDLDSNQFIDLEFPEELFISKLNIYETYYSDRLTAIKFRNKKLNFWKTVWESSSDGSDIDKSRIFRPELKKVLFKTNQIRIELCSVDNSFSQLDAIEMIGTRHIIDCVKSETNLRKDLEKLLNSEKLCDVQFEVDGQILKAHRNILISRSDYFRTLLCENLRPDRLSKPVHLSNITLESFRALLYYFYTDCIKDNTSVEICCELIRLSDWYEIPKLKNEAYLFCNRVISIENVCDLYISAINKEPKLEEIEKICLKFISKNFSALQNLEFKRLPTELVAKFSQFNSLF